MVAKKRISAKPISTGVFSTAGKAGLTASVQYTRGKELVEHDPLELIPDPSNPRPGESINDEWLKKVLKIGTPDNLCQSSDGTWIIPKFEDLYGDLKGVKKEDYDFLVQLAESIKSDGLIEPIEIFLADKRHEPEFFINSEREHGYVVLEGHQRRLASILGGISKITCIQITDDKLLAQLKVKHRKLRRQLSENNIRKDISPYQQYLIVSQLLSDFDTPITTTELSKIIGLNLKYTEALKRISGCEEGRYPGILYDRLASGDISLRKLTELSSKKFDEIFKILSDKNELLLPKKIKKIRGKSGGRTKKCATFKVSCEKDSYDLISFLQRHVPELGNDFMSKSVFYSLEDVMKKILELAKKEKSGTCSESL